MVYGLFVYLLFAFEAIADGAGADETETLPKDPAGAHVLLGLGKQNTCIKKLSLKLRGLNSSHKNHVFYLKISKVERGREYEDIGEHD